MVSLSFSSLRAFCVLLLVALLAPSSSAQSADPLRSYRPGHVPPDVSGTDQFGRVARLRSLRGKWVLLEFGASWCAPSRDLAKGAGEMEALMKRKRIPFTHMTVLMQGDDQATTNSDDAVQWSLNYGINKSVVHRSNLAPVADPLNYQLTCYGATTIQSLYAFMDPNPFTRVGGFPTLVLITPQHKIKKVYLGVPPMELIFKEMGYPRLSISEIPPEPLAFALGNYSVTATLGQNSATFNGLGVDWSLDEAAQEAGADQPSIGIVAARGSSTYGTYLGVRTFFTGLPTPNASAPEIPHQVPITFRYSNLAWGEKGAGTFLPVRTRVAVFDRLRQETSLEITPTVEPDGTIVLGPFTLEQLGLPADAVAVRLGPTLQWARPERLARVSRVLDNLAEIELDGQTYSRLAVAFGKVRAALAPPFKETSYRTLLEDAAAALDQSPLTVAKPSVLAELRMVLQTLLDELPGAPKRATRRR